MKRNFLLACTMLMVSASMAQTPATTNVPNAKFPAIYPDNSVEFRIKAPEAQKITVDLGQKYDMTKGEDGVWSVKTGPQSSGIHYYSLIVDGVSVSDPASETFYGCSRMMSCIEIPYKNAPQYEVKNVPHGDIRTVRYFSTVTNSWRQMYIYTPAGYDKDLNKKYPVIYIMHGGGEDARGWVCQGRSDLILDNLAAEGKAPKMILVSFDANVGGFGKNGPVEDEIMKNVVPFVEKNYRAIPLASKRALAGLSMGGIFTLQVGLPRSNFFGYLGVFSSGFFAGRNPFGGNGDNMAENSYKYLEQNKDMFNKNMKLFWIGIGGKSDIAYQNNEIMRNRLDKIGIKYTYFDHQEGGHTWPVWREDLYMFAQKIFK
jgi:enterochelin esterase-like enzyme